MVRQKLAVSSVAALRAMSAIMIQGTSSWAGKSFLTTALCRMFARRGLKVAPFKAQNMSNNARVGDGGEMGAAQYLQALAAGVVPDVRMNPVLVKPEGNGRAQVVINGSVDHELSRTPWPQRQQRLWPVIGSALQSLRDEFELLIIEGAGSPAEINLRQFDLVNMRIAQEADAPVLLVADIHRGGAFAHLYGTWALLNEQERARLHGFVLNKFRGDPALLAPGPRMLEELTSVPVIGVVPWLQHGLPDEDGAGRPALQPGRQRVVIVRYPTASNLDEFRLLEQVAQVVWAQTAAELDGAALVILPGSKHVARDLTWLRQSGLDAAITARATRGERVLAICGGLQLLGERIDDPHGLDGDGEGLGLLPLRTTFAREKSTRRTVTRFGELKAPWRSLSQLPIAGYEIRHGETTTCGTVERALPDELGFAHGAVLGVYLHGLLEDPRLVAALLGERPARTLEDTFDDLANVVERQLDLAVVDELVGVPA
jgi:adenosylcobyric acid synthase